MPVAPAVTVPPATLDDRLLATKARFRPSGERAGEGEDVVDIKLVFSGGGSEKRRLGPAPASPPYTPPFWPRRTASIATSAISSAAATPASTRSRSLLRFGTAVDCGVMGVARAS